MGDASFDVVGVDSGEHGVSGIGTVIDIEMEFGWLLKSDIVG